MFDELAFLGVGVDPRTIAFVANRAVSVGEVSMEGSAPIMPHAQAPADLAECA